MSAIADQMHREYEEFIDDAYIHGSTDWIGYADQEATLQKVWEACQCHDLAERMARINQVLADEPRTGTTGGSMFKVEKGVQMPPAKTRNVYPFSRMAVGDSFVVPPEMRYKAFAAARSFGIKHGCRFSTRKDGDQVRVWRIA